MNMNTKFYLSVAAGLLAAGAVASSCVDEKYDIDSGNIDGTVQIAQGGVKIPLATIEKYELSKLVDDVDQLKVTADGLLAFVATGTTDTDPIPGTAVAAGAVAAQGGSELELFSLPTNAMSLAEIVDGIDMLQGVKADLVAPRLKLSITNPANVTIGGTLLLQPDWEVADVAIEDLVADPSVNTPEPLTTWYFISEEGVALPDNDHEYKRIYPDNLGDVFETIGENVEGQFSATVKGGDPAKVDQTADYTFGASYELICPLAFGSEMRVPVKLTSTQVVDTFHDIADAGVTVSELGIVADIEASFPFKISGITAEFYDEKAPKGELIPGIDFVFNGEIAGPEPTTAGAGHASSVSMSLEVENGDMSILSSVKQMRMTLLLTPTATGNEVSGFRPEDFIQGKVWAVIPEGITVDINDL